MYNNKNYPLNQHYDIYSIYRKHYTEKKATPVETLFARKQLHK